MALLRQFAIIAGISCLGEGLRLLIPLPIPASVYGLVLMLCVVETYEVINWLLTLLLRLPAGEIPLGVGPILFGVFCTAVDVLFISIKHLILGAIKKA